MFEIFSWDFWLALWQHNSLLIMFVSAFLSATLLPGNSEIIFMAFATPLSMQYGYFSLPMMNLLAVAVLGNGLGSMLTFWIGRWFPSWDIEKQPAGRLRWSLEKLQKFGALFLLLSWLPIVGDVLCALAGWLRLNWISCLIFIMIGKFLRYLLLLFLGLGYWLF